MKKIKLSNGMAWKCHRWDMEFIWCRLMSVNVV